MDELFVLFDREREPWLVLQDASGDVAALCGRTSISQPAYVAAQWTWDAYGNVFSADHIFDHPFLSVGHKGLFVERLDVGVADATVPGAQYADTPRLTPFAHHIYHNRNRSYHPTLGRFLQADPNASGLVVHGHVMMHGAQPHAGVSRLGLEERHRDGANLYQYVRSSPWMNSDPLGLFVGNAGLGYLDMGATVGALAFDLVSVYAANQESDADWANDWELSDEFHTRSDASWIADIYSMHDIDSAVESANPFSNPFADRVARFRGRYLPDSLKLVNKMRKGWQGHHAFYRMITRWKTDSKELLIALPESLHKKMHQEVDEGIRKILQDAPSMWSRSDKWKKFMAVEGNLKRYIDAMIQATQEFENKLPDELKRDIGPSITETLRQSIGQL